MALLMRARETRIRLRLIAALPDVQLAPLDAFIAHGERQIDQIRRRVLCGQTIPHAEKVFSIFQPHSEWISKGKAGVPVELGLRVAISEDQHGFILHHRVMERITDDQIAVPLVEEIVARFPTVAGASMDKGFHSPANQRGLAEVFDFPVLPKKGKCSAAEREREGDPRFIQLRRKHSAVESAINADPQARPLSRSRDRRLQALRRLGGGGAQPPAHRRAAARAGGRGGAARAGTTAPPTHGLTLSIGSGADPDGSGTPAVRR